MLASHCVHSVLNRAAGYLDCVASRRFKPFADFNRGLNIHSAFSVILSADFYPYGELCCGFNAFYNKLNRFATVFKASAPPVFSSVAVGRKKIVEQIAVTSVKLNCVKSRLFGSDGCGNKIVDYAVYFTVGKFFCFVGIKSVKNIRRRNLLRSDNL